MRGMIAPRLGTVVLVLGLAACAAPTPAAPPASSSAAGPATSRQAWREMFARGYFPGRSGQLFLVPREGDVIVERDPLYVFMHGSPWDYDVHIPLLFSGAPFVRPGAYDRPATQQDVAPTLGALVGVAPAATMSGHVLTEALAPGQAHPRVIALLVLDAMRADYFDRYADVLPTLTRLRREGAWFGATRINYLPTVTSVGHATIGTGADPRVHGLAANNLFNRATGRAQPAYAGLDPRELMALTLADRWNLETAGRAVIIGQGGAIRATAGLVGHGACIVGGFRVLAASYTTAGAGWETNPECYTMPPSLAGFTATPYWQAAAGTWMGHDIASPSRFRASSLFQTFEGDALMRVAGEAAIGADDITDLVLVNMKGPDYVSHAYGPDSAELKETLAELDRQLARFVGLLEQKAGAGRFVVAVTADHGTPGEPAPGRRHHTDEISALINERFDPSQRRLVQYFDDAANAQIFVDTERLSSLGHSLAEVAAFLESQDFLAAVFTEDDLRRPTSSASRP